MDTSTAEEGGTYRQQPDSREQAELASQCTVKGGESLPQEDKNSTGPRQAGVLRRLRAHLAEEVSTSHADILMLTCCLISGFVDSTIYNAYGTFVSMQTGMLSSITYRPSNGT